MKTLSHFLLFAGLILLSATPSQAQLYKWLYFDPANEAKGATAEIPSDGFVNEYGDLTNKKYYIENEIFTEQDLVKRFYYLDNKLIAQRNYTIEGELTTDGGGLAIYEYQYNAKGNLVEVKSFDDEKKPAQLSFAGPAMIRYAYDDRGNRTEAAYFDKYYQPLELGSSVIRYSYNEQNQLVLEKHYDINGELLSDIAPIIRYSYDGNGKISKQEFLDANMKVITRLMDSQDEEDVAFISFEYANEKLSSKHYYNIKGKLLGVENSDQ